MSFGINKISMSSFGSARPGLAWPDYVIWPPLARLDLTLFVMAWLGPKAECVKFRIGLDTGDHVFLLLRFVLVALARPVPRRSPCLILYFVFVCLFFLFLILILILWLSLFYGPKLTQFHDSHHNLC